jgi:hypothetical protein
MSMSEFERRQRDAQDAFSHGSEHVTEIPDDFSEEDLAFARELHSLFSAEEEEIPPYYVQTLLDANDPRFQPAAPDLEQRTTVQVFRRLHLPHRLFRSQQRPWLSTIRAVPLYRPLFALTAACLAFMIITILATGNSFASGLAYLFAGQHSGVLQLHEYPTALSDGHENLFRHSLPRKPRQLNLIEAQRLLHFPMYWPTMPDDYMLSTIHLYVGRGPSWSLIDGPILEMTYQYSVPGEKPKAPGEIKVWEFKPLGDIYQAVQIGSAHQVQVGPDGQAGLIVDGQWEKINETHRWVYNGSGELICERNGVIFWIQGDQNSGIDQKALVDIANSLTIYDVLRITRVSSHMNVTQEDDVIWLSAPDADSPNGPSLIIVDSEETQMAPPKGNLRFP